MAFKCEPGKPLTNQEVVTMLGFDEAGLPRPDEYANVVFDNTSGAAAGYRCQTQEELDSSAKAAKADAEAAKAAADAKAAAYKSAGIDPETGASTQPVAFNKALDLPPAPPTETATGVATGDKAK